MAMRNQKLKEGRGVTVKGGGRRVSEEGGSIELGSDGQA